MSDVTLADVQDDLYGGPADEFVRRRADAVRAAKQRDDRDLAEAIGSLRKPTAAAQVLNSFVRARGAEIDALLDVGTRLRTAVDRGDGDGIRAAMRERGRAVTEVMRSIRAYADDQLEPLSSSVASQVEQSLRAAMTSEEDALQLRRGVLAAALSDSGIDAMREVTPPAAAPKPSTGRARRDRDDDRDDGDDRDDRGDEVAAARARRQAAEARASAAADTVERIRGELDGAVSQRSELEEERQASRARLEEIEQRLRAARDAESDIESRLREAQSELRTARSAARRQP